MATSNNLLRSPMYPAPDALLRRWLAERLDSGLLRRLRCTSPVTSSACFTQEGRQRISFASNDYLGLSHHPVLVEALREGAAIWGVGAGSSALVGGYTEAHAALEADLAEFLGFAAARVFTSGYAANLAVITAFSHEAPTAIFADKRVHASLVDAMQLARSAGARVRRYPHGDHSVLSRWLEESQEPVKLVVTDGVFSMDGDIAPLEELSQLARTHGAWLIVDDAHGFGVLGPEGRGSFADAGMTPQPHWLWVITFGKAAGTTGAAILGTEDAMLWLDQAARTHIYTTAMPPALAHTVRIALRLVREESARRARLGALIRRWRQGMTRVPGIEVACSNEAPSRNRTHPPCLPFSRTPIQPLVLGSPEQVLAIEQNLAQNGFFVPAIRPPTVPRGTARLRLSLCADHDETMLESLLETLRRIFVRIPSLVPPRRAHDE